MFLQQKMEDNMVLRKVEDIQYGDKFLDQHGFVQKVCETMFRYTGKSITFSVQRLLDGKYFPAQDMTLMKNDYVEIT
jgi:hypothetical protein